MRGGCMGKRRWNAVEWSAGFSRRVWGGARKAYIISISPRWLKPALRQHAGRSRYSLPTRSHAYRAATHGRDGTPSRRRHTFARRHFRHAGRSRRSIKPATIQITPLRWSLAEDPHRGLCGPLLANHASRLDMPGGAHLLAEQRGGFGVADDFLFDGVPLELAADDRGNVA